MTDAFSERDTIAAIATAPGRGGVAVIRISGAHAFDIAKHIIQRAITPADAGRFFHTSFHHPDSNKILDDGLVLVFTAPHSYTGENVIELQGHGGSVVPRRILEACVQAGARLARRGEFTLRAFLNGRLDLTKAEAVIDLVDARTDRAADDALLRLKGSLAKSFDYFYEQALDLSVRLEHTLDFDEDEIPPDFISKIQTDIHALIQDISLALKTARDGRLVREGALVVLAGAPNAGKSSLLNALLGEARAIVSNIAGTTRDTLEEGLIIDGWQIRLTDTAGLRTTNDLLEQEGVKRSEALIHSADLVLALDCNLPNALCIHAKCDLDKPDVSYPVGLRVSAKTGEGLAELRTAIVERLAQLSAKSDEASGADVTTRQVELLEDARTALQNGTETPDLVLAANACRQAADACGRLTGRVYSNDLLDVLFSRFCIGK